MNKTDLINAVALATEVSKKEATLHVEAILNAIANELADGGNVKLIGFGNFEVRERSARTGRNPQTGEEIQIPASKKPAFKPSKTLKNLVQ